MQFRDKNFYNLDEQPSWIKDGYGTRFQEFQSLMHFRIRDILLVASLYDLYVFEEDGRLYELLLSEYQGLNLSHIPELIRVFSGRQAIEFLEKEKRFDLIITTLHIEDMRPAEFAQIIRERNINIPIIMLASDNQELAGVLSNRKNKYFDKIFIWLGNFRLLLAIIKFLEDRMNVEHDTNVMGVQSIIVIEDNIYNYSKLLPLLYLEIMQQSQRLIKEGVNPSHKNLRQRARPKLLLCSDYEEAWNYFNKYKNTILGVISDIDFPRKDEEKQGAGIELAKKMREEISDLPILLNSSNEQNRYKAQKLSCDFVLKNSPQFVLKLRKFMFEELSFGDFIFKTPDNKVVDRATDLLSLEKAIARIPEESFVYHAERNHFSNWLKARTEFWLAYQLRPRKITDFPSVDVARKHLISKIKNYLHIRQSGIVTDFQVQTFEPDTSISRIGTGSLGGKARGLNFINTLISNYNITNRFKGVYIHVPPAIIIATDIFNRFMEKNDLTEFSFITTDNKELLYRFLKADYFSENTKEDLRVFVEMVDTPLAVRSSSLLEDSHQSPFAGVYETYMLPNSHPDIEVRLTELINAIKKVYASTYTSRAKAYTNTAGFRLEEEKMAVIVQKLCGDWHGERYYPTFSGTIQSHNYYPVKPQKAEDGIASIALGLGKMVAEGGKSVRFSPVYPRHLIQFSTPQLALENNQHEFFALNLNSSFESQPEIDDYYIKKYDLKKAEEDEVLYYVGSTYSPENDAVYQGIHRPGIRVVDFAPILKSKIFPLAEILKLILELGRWGMGTPVEIEFAVNIKSRGKPSEFSLLQIRPMMLYSEGKVGNLEKVDKKDLICFSNQVLGNGVLDDLYDIVYVDKDSYQRSKSREVAEEINKINSQLMGENRRYLLIGVGRWGSLDPWLGIPVKWEQISGAGAIIETGFKDLHVDPSQGSHFFENLNSFMVGYFTVEARKEESFVDWDFLKSVESVNSTAYVKHLRFNNRVLVKMNGRKNCGIIQKPKEEN
ncbi:MAG: PEP/pyruvate-binding domain-containing protein [bacterium]